MPFSAPGTTACGTDAMGRKVAFVFFLKQFCPLSFLMRVAVDSLVGKDLADIIICLQLETPRFHSPGRILLCCRNVRVMPL